MNSQGRILNIDSDAVGRRFLHCDLLAAGFDVTDAEYLDEAIAFSRVMQFDVVLFGIDPHEHPNETCRALRSAASRAALVVLTPYDYPDRNVEMIEAGADQCLARPLHIPEFMARIRAILRRMPNSEDRPAEAIAIGEIRLDPDQRVVYRAGEPVRLTPKEFTLLHYLMSHAGRPIAHSTLLKTVWGEEHVGRVEYLRIFMQQLRTKLRDNVNPRYLLTDSCIGYHFVEAAKAPFLHGHIGQAA